jgi:protein ImuB
MLWLALHLPWLPLEALPATQALAEAAVAAAPACCCVIEQRRVLVADAHAQALGVLPGMSSATASSLAPQVRQFVREAEREAAFVLQLALALSRYTPQVVIEPDGVLLEVQASLRLFGGLRSLVRQVRRTARAWGAQARLAVAPTAAAASLLARVATFPARALRAERAHRLLDQLPLPTVLAVLGEAPRLAELLQAIGCRQLGEVRALPRAGLQRRGGAGLQLMLDKAYGQAPDPRVWFEPPPEFAAELELMHRADQADMLVFAAQRLLQPLCGWLSRHWLAASRLRLELRHERGRQAVPDTLLQLKLGVASRDEQQLLTLLRERLHRTTLVAPVYWLRLVLEEAHPCAGADGQLLPDPGQAAQDFAALLDRLRARLGAEQVQHLSLRADHRPEHAYAAASHRPANLAAAAAAAKADPALALAAQQLPRPLWLLPTPLRLGRHGERPVHGSMVLNLLTRAERIEAGWFDGGLVCRDYYVAEGSDHRLRWVYCERRHQADDEENAWFLHGLFA